MKKSKSAKKPHRPVPPAPRAKQQAHDDDYAAPKIGVMKRLNTFASLAIAIAIVASFFVTMLIPLFSAP